ncbi:uncharacterized protein LOC119437164 isoform X2 [Dermacentor silvarum]|uniref:uncharacterized protein LOC119437164 isoform X2 n=1 Tax=Dermacentor silvarum TaxID=543639 RepID=UPI0021010693|nr:uncharacterized protein LOC119437164 isoform X2 [Dermacentor silvarum]
METAMVDGGASPRRILWDSISRAAERMTLPPLDDYDLFKGEPESPPSYRKELPGSLNEEKAPITPPAQSSRNFVRPCLTSVPNVIAEMVTAAHCKQLLETRMFHPCRSGIGCNNGNAKIIVGSDGVLSASVHESSRCLHVQLQGMKVLQRYFVSVDVPLYEEKSSSSEDIATYVAPQPNLLDGFGWAKSTLHLDLSAHLKERLRSSSTHPVVFPCRIQDVACLGDHTPFTLTSFGPYSFPFPTPEFQDSCPWQEEFGADGTRGQALFQREILEGPAMPFCCQEKAQFPRFRNVFGNGFTPQVAYCDDHFAVDRGQATFFRDLDREALLRLIHLDQRRPSTTLPPGNRWQQHWRCPCDKRRQAVPFGVGTCEEDLFGGRDAWSSAEPRFF